MATKKSPKHYRDAGTGHYVSKNYAERHPKTTVSERPRKGGSKKGK